MTVAKILITFALSFLAASLSDWLFMGVLFHERYKTFPEVWRDSGTERSKIMVAQLYCAMSAIGFVWLATYLGPFSLGSALAVAALIWLIGPLPLLLGNHLFIKFDPYVTATHAIGWLVKLLLIALISAFLL
jgi:hypothetical protein